MRVRKNIPQSRNKFHPTQILEKIYGANNNIIVMDSNELPEGWREKVLIENVNKNRAWNKAKDYIRDWNMEHEDALMEINNINRNDQEVDDLENQSLPSDDDMENIWREKKFNRMARKRSSRKGYCIYNRKTS